MNIRSFRIRKYRNIEDSGDIELLDRLTCIVGKNQSGKTALLRALHKFNPHVPDPYDIRKEWPREQRAQRDGKQVVCEVRFELTDAEKARLAELSGRPIAANEVLITKDYEGTFAVRLPDRPGDAPGEQQRAHEYLLQQIPTFIYMDDYKSFRGRADLVAIRHRLHDSGARLGEEDETFLMILRLAGLDLDRLIEQGASRDEHVLHDRQLDLQDAAAALTGKVAGRWAQNAYRIQFRTDGQVFFTEVEEVGKNIGMIPLEEQSKGFQWFFSFDLHFMHDSQGTFAGCVLLLDEPGLHLHPGGQRDLLQRLDAYAAKSPTIYSTHLPFLVDLREPGRIKVIHQGDARAVVSDDLGASHREERLALQAALGMQASQSHLVAERSLLVESVDDYWIVSELSNALERAGEGALPDDVMVTAAGGPSEVVHTASFMIGQGLQTVALFASDEAGRHAEETLRTKWLTRYDGTRSATLLLGDAVEAAGGDFTLEDLFPEHYYLSKVRGAHAKRLRAVGKDESDITLSGTGPLLPRVARACETLGLPFDKSSVAKLIRKDLMRVAKAQDMPRGTADKARKLMSAIREAFGEPPS